MEVPDETTYTQTQRTAQEQLTTKALDLMAARKLLIQAMPAVGADTNGQTDKVAALQSQIDDRWRLLEDQAWPGLDDQQRLAVCRASDTRRGQLIADENSQKTAGAAFWTAYTQWQQQDQAAREARQSQQQLDDILRQIGPAQLAVTNTGAQLSQTQADLDSAIEPRQPVDADVTVTPIESRQWWYVGAIGTVWMGFMIAMFAMGVGNRDRYVPEHENVLGDQWHGELPDEPTPPRGPGSARDRGGRLTA
jgi:hypothetical protein